MTGWKVGYSVGAPKLIEAAAKAHQFLTFTTPPNLQKAVAYGLSKDAEYFKSLGADMQAKRDRFGEGLRKIGFDVMDSQGTYFLTVDYRPLGYKGNDVDFCKHLTTEAGVAAVPFSPFYRDGTASGVDHFARFCYCKKNSLLDEALERLGNHF
jgi:aspartate/methionine/tyrosine aminotransferase